MKNLTLLFYVVFLCVANLFAASETNKKIIAPTLYEEAVKVETAKQLENAIKNNKHIRLMADIDVSSIETIDYFSKSIVGTLDKDSIPHKLYNLKNHVLIYKAENATFKNLMIDSCSYLLTHETENCTFENIFISRINLTFSESNNIGCITRVAKNCKFNNVNTFANYIKTKGAGAGGVCGLAENCEFRNCSTDFASIIFADGNSPYLGWLDNTFNLNGNMDNYANVALAGGFCGRARDCKFYDCTNNSTVAGGEDEVGGFTGESIRSEFYDCVNYGFIAHSNEGQIDKLMYSTTAFFSTFPLASIKLYDKLEMRKDYIQLLSLFADNNAVQKYRNLIFVFKTFYFVCLTLEIAYMVYGYQDHDELGGICGHSEDGKFFRCINSGICHCGDAYSGGIIGYSDKSILSNCLNTNLVIGNEQTGGIVGCSKNGSIIKCLNIGFASANSKVDEICGDPNKTEWKNNISFKENDKKDRKIIYTGELADTLNHNNNNATWKQEHGVDIFPKPCPYDEAYKVKINENVSLIDSVSNITEFQMALCNSEAHIVLKNDINLGSAFFGIFKYYTTENHKFKGIIDGNGFSFTGAYIDDAMYNDESFNKAIGQAAELTYKQLGVEYSQQDVALIRYAEGAKFKNIKFKKINIGGAHNVATLCINSKKCKYENISIEDSTKIKAVQNLGGLISHSNQDTIINCSTSKDCLFNLNTTYNVGGLVAEANGSVFEKCTNGACIVLDYNAQYGGGIVGSCNNCKINACQNSGYLASLTNWPASAICSQCENSEISNCLNEGYIQGKETTVLAYDAKKSTFSNCLNLFYFDTKEKNRNICYKTENCTFINNYFRDKEYKDYGKGYCAVNDEQIRNGEVTSFLNKINRGKDTITFWEQNIAIDEHPMLGSNDIYFAKKSSENYEAIVLPFNALSNDSIQFYDIRSINPKTQLFELKKIDLVPTGTPCVYSSTSDNVRIQREGLQFMQRELDTILINDNFSLIGTYEEKHISSDLYPVYTIKNGILNEITSEEEIGPFTAYIQGKNVDNENDTQFEEESYKKVSIKTNNLESCKISVNGEEDIQKTIDCKEGEVISIEAIESPEYTFIGWSDGVKGAKRLTVVTDDLNLTAVFASIKIDGKHICIKAGENEEIQIADMSSRFFQDDDYILDVEVPFSGTYAINISGAEYKIFIK